ncbi:MAG: prolyl oligopeptidase family serine peptidase [Actinomycetota bacterium]
MPQELPPPPAVDREELVEVLHGHEVADPYRWLEAPAHDHRVQAFIAAQDAAARAHLHALPSREHFLARLRALWNHPRRSTPWRRGSWWFQLRNDGLQDQDVLWVAAGGQTSASATTPPLPEEEQWRVLLDPNTWSADGTASLSGLAVSDDGTRVAFGRADAGSDWTTWRVVEVATARTLGDEVPWSKFANVTWLPDATGFVYTAYDPPSPGDEHAAANRDQRLQLHRLGSPVAEDVVVLSRPDHPEWGYHPQVSHDGRWLVIVVTRGTDPQTGVLVAPIDGDGSIGAARLLLAPDLAQHEPIGVLGEELLVVTDLDAPLGRIIAVPLPARDAVAGEPPATGGPVRADHVREVVAEGAQRLLDARLVGAAGPELSGWLVCHRLQHASSRLDVVSPRDGTPMGNVPLPWPVTVTGTSGGRHDDRLHLAVGAFTAPDHLLACELGTLAVSRVWDPAPAGAPGDHPGTPTDTEVVVEQVAVRHGATSVPLFLVHRADVHPDGRRPTVLWGYGGFDIPVTPMHRPGWRAWVEAGGVLAVACLRGGGEYGAAWRDDGRRAHKEHVFDDALACAAWLTGRDRDRVRGAPLGPVGDPEAVWTRPQQLGIEGRSNGGLLVGACLTRAPEAFGSAVPEVGVLDLVRFHRFTIGWAWTSDYGAPDDPEDLAVLLRYSPYHRLEEGRSYPPTLLTTGDTDDRVVPLHSFKFAAALQHAQGAAAPVLLRIDRAAGHGAGKPVTKLLEERADVLAFHAAHLGLDPAHDR